MYWIAIFIVAIGTTDAANESLLNSTAYVCNSVIATRVLPRVSKGQSGLDSFVGRNILQELLYDPDCNFDSICLHKYLNEIILTLVTVGSGIIMAAIMIVCFGLFSPCFCSRRCRQWKGWKRLREYEFAHDMNGKLRNILGVLFGVVVLASLIDIGLAAQGKWEMDTGLNSALCSTYEFLNETLNGGEATVFQDSQGYVVDAQFPGLTHAAEVLTNLTNVISPNSTLVVKLGELMTTVRRVEQEYVLLESTFDSLTEVMRANNFSNHHECIFCRNFSKFPSDSYPNHPVNPSAEAITNSLAGVLTDMGSRLKPFLIDSLSLLYNILNDTSSGIDSFVSNLTSLINDTVLKNLDLIYDIFKIFDISIILALSLTALPILMGACVLAVGAYGSARGDIYSDASHPPTAPWVAGLPIAVTFVTTLFTFLVAGVLLVAAYGLASVCLVMEDAGSIAAKMSFRFGTPEISARVVAIVGQCLRSDSDGDILSAITIDADSTARDKIGALTALGGEFTVMRNAIDNGQTNTNLSTNRYLSNMGVYLASVGNLYIITAEEQANMLSNFSDFIPTNSSLVFNTSEAIGEALFNETARTAPQCAPRSVWSNSTPPGVLQALSNYTSIPGPIPGYSVGGYVDMISALTLNNVSTGVNDTCPAVAVPDANLVPWGNLVSTKIAMMNKTTYRCDQPGVQYTPSTMSYSPLSVQLHCNASAYGTYMATFGARIATQAARVDAVVGANYQNIFDQLWSVIYDELMQPAQWLGSTLNCQFISLRWNTLFNSLCMVLTPTLILLGKLLLGLGFAGVYVLVMQIAVWRHLKDNMCLWQDTVKRARLSEPGGVLRRVSSFTVLQPRQPVS